MRSPRPSRPRIPRPRPGFLRRRRRLLLILAALTLVASSVTIDYAPVADAAKNKPGKNKGGGGGGADAPTPDTDADTGDGEESPGRGTVNPLNLNNPLCGGSLRSGQRDNCERYGSPEARYPATNYALDIHVDTGLTNISGNFKSLLAHIASMIWQLAVYLASMVMGLLGWVYGLSPFQDNSVLRDIDRALGRLYRGFTSTWLVFAIVFLGAWTVYKGLIRREASASVGGVIFSLVLMVAALAIVRAPGETVGEVTELTNDAALAALAAPQKGGISDPEAAYAAGSERLWLAMTVPGFVLLNFSDASWAMEKPDPDALKTSSQFACLDYQAAGLDKNAAAAIALGLDGWEDLCDRVEVDILKPRTNAELWLRSSPGSASRDAIWDRHAKDPSHHLADKLSIQGEGGAWIRLPLAIIAALGLLGGVLLIGWIALRLMIQTAVALVLTLAAPIALLFPAFGESGRNAFMTWGTTLLGAILSKLIYSVLLSVVIFATTTVNSLALDAGGVGSLAAALVTAGFWWSVFLKRDQLLSFVTVDSEQAGGMGKFRMGQIASSVYLGKQAVGLAGAPFRGAAQVAGGAGRLLKPGEGSGDTDGSAQAQIDGSIDRALGARRDGNQATVDAQQGRQDQLAQSEAAMQRWRYDYQLAQRQNNRPGGQPGSGGGRELVRLMDQGQQLQEQINNQRAALAAGAPAAAAASRALASQGGREERSGTPWSGQDRQETAELLRRQSNLPDSDPAHAWRVGHTPESLQQLGGAERVEAQREIAQQLREDRAALGVIPDGPEANRTSQQGRQLEGNLQRVEQRVRTRNDRARRTLDNLRGSRPRRGISR